MTQDIIAKATNRLAAIGVEIETLQSEAREIAAALSVLRRFGDIPDGIIPAAAIAGDTAAPPIAKEVASDIEAGARNAISQGFQMSQAEFEVLASRAMDETGRPITRTQLLRWMEENGTPLLGSDASKNVGTKLWRARNRFTNIRGSGYWFRDRPCPAVGYDPATDNSDDFLDRAEEDEAKT